MTHLFPAWDSLGSWPCGRRRPGAEPGAGGRGECRVRGRAALGEAWRTQTLPANLEEGHAVLRKRV